MTNKQKTHYASVIVICSVAIYIIGILQGYLLGAN